MNKRCHHCGETQDVSNFAKCKARKDGLQVYCRICMAAIRKPEDAKRWYNNHKEQNQARARQYYAGHREARIAYQKQRQAGRPEAAKAENKALVLRHKREVMAAYGGEQCACCGETNLGFLSIDHISGCGKELRTKHGLGSRFYAWLKRNNYPEGFQVLCFNCNIGRSHFGGICPHKLS